MKDQDDQFFQNFAILSSIFIHASRHKTTEEITRDTLTDNISYSHRSMSFLHVSCANATELVSLKEHQTSAKNVSTLKVTICMMVYVTAVQHWGSKADILPMPLSHTDRHRSHNIWMSQSSVLFLPWHWNPCFPNPLRKQKRLYLIVVHSLFLIHTHSKSIHSYQGQGVA